VYLSVLIDDNLGSLYSGILNCATLDQNCELRSSRAKRSIFIERSQENLRGERGRDRESLSLGKLDGWRRWAH
jgi:hypothetical protein